MEKKLNNGLQIVRAGACITIVVHHLLGQYWNIKTEKPNIIIIMDQTMAEAMVIVLIFLAWGVKVAAV